MILASRGPLGRPLGGFLERLGSLLDRLWVILAVLGRCFGDSGPSWAVVAASWGSLGPYASSGTGAVLLETGPLYASSGTEQYHLRHVVGMPQVSPNAEASRTLEGCFGAVSRGFMGPDGAVQGVS